MNTIQSFADLALSDSLNRALEALRHYTPTPIQAQAIPLIQSGRDVLGCAQTGTGKTAAFTLPILQRLEENPAKPVTKGFRVLVLAPTRELAGQVAASFREYGQNQNARIGTVYGGVGFHPQIKALRKGLDILVATPGRLLDLFRQGELRFDQVEHLVLDEADRMLDMGFLPDIRTVVAELPRQRQTLFFSATFSRHTAKLAGEILNDPAEIRVEPTRQTADKVDHRLCFLQRDHKAALLQSLLADQRDKDGRQLTLVFSRTKQGADRLARNLAHSGLRAESIHGNKTQNARQRALDKFRRGQSPILVATDVAARGIDVKDISLVVNFDMPNEPEAYIHRIGRTARAGSAGRALSFCTREDLRDLQAIESLLRSEIQVFHDHEFHDAKLLSQRGDRRGAPRKPQKGKRPFRKNGGPAAAQRGNFKRKTRPASPKTFRGKPLVRPPSAARK